MTLRAGLDADDVVAALPPGSRSAKDSFADVDPAPAGFRTIGRLRVWMR